jgi:hypothetical protein
MCPARNRVTWHGACHVLWDIVGRLGTPLPWFQTQRALNDWSASRQLPGGVEKNRDKLMSGHSVLRMRFELEASECKPESLLHEPTCLHSWYGILPRSDLTLGNKEWLMSTRQRMWAIRLVRWAMPDLQIPVFVLSSTYNTTQCSIIANTENIIFRNPKTVTMSSKACSVREPSLSRSQLIVLKPQ